MGGSCCVPTVLGFCWLGFWDFVVFYLLANDWEVWTFAGLWIRDSRLGQSASASSNPPVWATYNARPGKRERRANRYWQGMAAFTERPCNRKRSPCADACRQGPHPPSHSVSQSIRLLHHNHSWPIESCSLPCQHTAQSQQTVRPTHTDISMLRGSVRPTKPRLDQSEWSKKH